MHLFFLFIPALCAGQSEGPAPSQGGIEERLKKLEEDLERLRLEAAASEPVKGLPAAGKRGLLRVSGNPGAGPARLVQEETDLDKALREAETRERPAVAPSTTDMRGLKAGPVTLRFIDLSLDALFAAGTSNQPQDEIQNLQGGGHDPRKRGFTVQNVELSVAAAVDPYLTAEAHFVYFIDPEEGESVVELEEAFATTTSLPFGLQLEMGHFFTEFGRINPQHPHQWDFLDQPVINTRLFGPDGMRAPGFRLGWLMPLPVFSELHFGMQNANGETMASFFANDEFFEERPVGGRPFVDQDVHNLGDLVYLARWNGSYELTEEVTAVLGLSGLFGPNATGSDGETRIYGVDLKVKWRPERNFRGWPFVVWQTELMMRDYEADDGLLVGPDLEPDTGDEIPVGSRTLSDQGLYTYLLWGFAYGWVAGARFELAGQSGNSLDPATGADATKEDPFRDDRMRISAMVGWHPTEFSRVRLQYNYDVADHLDNEEEEKGHSVWLGMEFFFGAHPAHKY